MSALLLIAGCVLGFIGGTIAYFGFDAGALVALGIWAASGPVSLILLSLLRSTRSVDNTRRQTEIA